MCSVCWSNEFRGKAQVPWTPKSESIRLAQCVLCPPPLGPRVKIVICCDSGRGPEKSPPGEIWENPSLVWLFALGGPAPDFQGVELWVVEFAHPVDRTRQDKICMLHRGVLRKISSEEGWSGGNVLDSRKKPPFQGQWPIIQLRSSPSPVLWQERWCPSQKQSPLSPWDDRVSRPVVLLLCLLKMFK